MLWDDEGEDHDIDVRVCALGLQGGAAGSLASAKVDGDVFGGARVERVAWELEVWFYV